MKVYNEQTLTQIRITFETNNVSFLKMAALLNTAGVKNNLFFLRLDDKKLEGVNPYDPNLSDEMRVRIWRECVNNRWYFFREVYRVVEGGAATGIGGGSEFRLNRGNLAYLWAMELNISTYLIMPRQTGKTWAAIADAAWTHQFVRGSSILHFNKNQGDANSNLRRIQDSIRMLPLWMQHSADENLDPSDKRLVKNNEKSIRNTINATIEAMASAGNEAKADAIARGKTASKIWYDEMAFIFFNEAIYGAATPAYEKAREVAEKNGAPFAISITTTPGDLATPHGAFAYKMMESSIQFTEAMYDWKRKKLMDRIYNTPDKTDFIFIQFSHLQLGETDEWYLKRAKKMNNPIKARREYLLEWINSNGNSPFDPDDVEMIGDLSRQRALSVEQFTINKYFNLNVYSEYHGRKPVIISVDVAGSIGRDSTAAVVVNPETLMPMAFFRSNMIPSDQLKKFLVTLVTKRYPHCILTIENNSIGHPLLDELQDTPIRRVLYKERKKKQIDQGPSSFTKKKKTDIVEYGHNTNQTSRAQMMEMLESIVHNSYSHVAFPELYEEIRHLELKNGRIDHGSATHDDCVMAYMGALWIVRYGTGLKGRGIYYTLQDNDDADEFAYDTRDSFRAADRAIFGGVHDDESDDFIDYMMREHPVEDSSTLAAKERAEYFAELDRIEGITDDEGDGDALSAIEAIPDATEKLMLRNLYSMMHQYDDDDHILDLLEGQRGQDLGGDFRSKEDWATLYRY